MLLIVELEGFGSVVVLEGDFGVLRKGWGDSCCEEEEEDRQEGH